LTAGCQDRKKTQQHSTSETIDSTPVGQSITQQELDKSANNLKQIALWLQTYNNIYGKLPINERTKDGKPILSWRVSILRFTEQEDLYKQFKLDEPWDSETNKKLIEKIPEIYAPVRGKAEKGMTFYQAFGGKHGWMRPGATIPSSFPDGTTNTFLVAEGAKPVIWTKPDDMDFDGTTVPNLGGMFDGRFTVAFADGHVQRFKKDIDKDVLKLLIDPSDGMVIPDLGGVTELVNPGPPPPAIPSTPRIVLAPSRDPKREPRPDPRDPWMPDPGDEIEVAGRSFIWPDGRRRYYVALDPPSQEKLDTIIAAKDGNAVQELIDQNRVIEYTNDRVRVQFGYIGLGGKAAVVRLLEKGTGGLGLGGEAVVASDQLRKPGK
jgi:prepilin-type processing-associated H-X9-DG protein